ncbi:rifin PIR protein, putative [Plasmodium reichenowi]|uniref:Rifin PIR protein, putative n=1 Tax=Plasmodium reichenowi TaxID=5854 RepID=A0A2P9DSY1_PLARE|nr:rifin PIR protein, putative [Plasmodium reichenowi]
MKVHYINILLFVFPLNILAYNNKNKQTITLQTPKIPIARLLCECELYVPANYDNDPQMKEVMENFNKQTQQRFHEYDERMKTTRQKCKEKCDKEIQKIILKDKLEKQMEQQLTTLETKISTDDIPTCVCEKSIADKVEKGCLMCGTTMGGVTPGYCLVSGLWYAAWTNYVPIAVEKAAIDAGMEVVIRSLKTLGVKKIPDVIFEGISSIDDFSKVTNFAGIIRTELEASCGAPSSSTPICSIVKNGRTGGPTVQNAVSTALNQIAGKADQAAKTAEGIEAANYASTTSSLTTGISASIFAIEVIVLIMVIIYLILRYRRKKKMKKKLQYIKLLEE